MLFAKVTVQEKKKMCNTREAKRHHPTLLPPFINFVLRINVFLACIFFVCRAQCLYYSINFCKFYSSMWQL